MARFIRSDQDYDIDNEMVRVGELIYPNHKVYKFERIDSICGADCDEWAIGRVPPVSEGQSGQIKEIRYGICLLPKGHKRNHTNNAFCCDFCGKYRRGYHPYKSADEFQWCFLCDMEMKRKQYTWDHYGV